MTRAMASSIFGSVMNPPAYDGDRLIHLRHQVTPRYVGQDEVGAG